MDHELLTMDEVAARLRRPRKTLKNWRYQGLGPRGHRFGKAVLYSRAEVDRWIAAQQAAEARTA